MDTGKNRIVGKNTKRALKSTLFAVLLSASLSLEGLAAMTADGPGAAYESAGAVSYTHLLYTKYKFKNSPLRGIF